MKRALIVGHRGQDGTLLTARLIELGYEVVGIGRGTTEAHGVPSLAGEAPSIHDASAVDRLVASLAPDEIYYLAAFHHSSEDRPIEPGELIERSYAVNVSALVHFLEAMRNHAPQARLFYAASSHVFGEPSGAIQDEQTPIKPICIYGITKASGLHLCHYYRRAHSLHASVGILYNHESHLRDEKFVTKKIVKGALAIKRGQRDKLVVGNLAAEVDWGHAADYVDAMHRILSLDEPGDFVVATGEKHSVGQFVELAFAELGIDWRTHVVENAQLITKTPFCRVGNAGKITRATGWRPTTSFPAMVRALIAAEIARESVAATS
jgi:GDPmannose 4,6-dehydratase